MAENYYDTGRGLSEYLLLHYGGYESRLPVALAGALDFPARCVSECLNPALLPEQARALDLGCAVGRSSFELARFCAEVVGIDFSMQFIGVSTHLRDHGAVDFKYVEEGELTRTHRAVVPHGIDRKRASFEKGDAVRLRPDLGTFDALLMANLIDRLDDPAKCLAQLAGLLNSGGQLIITSPYTWLAEYTPRENWLGGFLRDGRTVSTFDALQERLAPHFEFSNRQDLPFVIHEHSRKFQLGFADASVWLRK